MQRLPSIGIVLIALLMAAYPLLDPLITPAANSQSAYRPLALYIFLIAGIVAAVGVIAPKRWWPLSAAAASFFVALLAYPITTRYEILFYGTLALGLLFLTNRTPTTEPGAAKATTEETTEETMPTEQEDLEVLKHRLERERFQWEKASRKSESTMLNRHFGVIVTAIVSIAAVVVSLAQIKISSNNAQTQIDYEKIKNDRQFYLEAARFLLTFEKDLKTPDTERIAYFRDVVVSSFPPEVATQVATTMRDTSALRNPAAAKIWDDGLRYLRNKDARPTTR
jgi:hypothetical protein